MCRGLLSACLLRAVLRSGLLQGPQVLQVQVLQGPQVLLRSEVLLHPGLLRGPGLLRRGRQRPGR